MVSAQAMGRCMRAAFLFLCTVFALPAANYYVIISGLGGTPEYETQFAKWATDLDHEFRRNGPDAHVVTLSGGTATRQHVEQMFSHLGCEVRPEDAFTLLLIGHGTFDGTDYKFNLPGPDMT